MGTDSLARPEVGRRYRQEFAPGEAEDEATIFAVNVIVSTGLGRFRGCIKTRESTLLEPGVFEYKHYCPNVGLVLIVAPSANGGAETVKLGVR